MMEPNESDDSVDFRQNPMQTESNESSGPSAELNKPTHRVLAGEVTNLASDLTTSQVVGDEVMGALGATRVVTSSENSNFPRPGEADFNSSVLDDGSKIDKRYAIIRELGSGGFGRVFLAMDTSLERQVAIKVAHSHRSHREIDVKRFLAEARTLASLDHPNIVPIYDVSHSENRLYVITKYIDGETLGDRLATNVPTVGESVRLIKSVAETLSCIHSEGIVHRDIKPANLLIDRDGQCFVNDFGLAMREDGFGSFRGRVGTISYMSPEQARGESHLVDGRSDLFSLGVVMYEILTGCRPFTASDGKQLINQICNFDPKPIRQLNPDIPKELERICMRLLAKRASERYLAAKDLADDLGFFSHDQSNASTLSLSAPRQFATPKSEPSASRESLVGIVPRGLRAFEEEDASFFHTLLPGPRGRNGVPDSIRFWRRRIETSDPTQWFRVGVIYGTSGSGKSSFVQAGLLPTLDARIKCAFIEASGDRTERQLLYVLRIRCPQLPSDLDLVESLSWIRRSDTSQSGVKVLIILDQFEQWLHARGDQEHAELMLALRQCDGEKLQCILLVRDDYWIGVSRLADQLEIDLVRRQNLAMVDLFDRRHAWRVLAEYGRGYSRLPGKLDELSSGQVEFLDQAINGLAENEKIVPVQLATFAEIMKSRDWNVKTLDEVGGIEGVGVRFLEESLGSKAAPEIRSHTDAAEAILMALLPEAGTNIKGSMQSESHLRSISGLESHPRVFRKIISILDSDLRLITPTDPLIELVDVEKTSERYFQLTHDFLIPAVRQWLQRSHQRTFRGRATQRLVDRTDVWISRPEKRHLPSWFEWASLLALTKHSRWNENERRMMTIATRTHSRTFFLICALLGVLTYAGYQAYGRNRANGLIDQLQTAETSNAPEILNALDGYKQWSTPGLMNLAGKSSIGTSAGLHARVALLRHHPEDQGLLDELSQRLLTVDISEMPLLKSELGQHSKIDQIVQGLWSILLDPGQKTSQRFRAGLALVTFDAPAIDSTNDDPIRVRWKPVQSFLIERALRQAIIQPGDYATILSTLADAPAITIPELSAVFRRQDPSDERKKSLNMLLDLLKDDPIELTRQFLYADGSQVPAFLPALDRFPTAKIEPELRRAINLSPADGDGPVGQQAICNQQVNAAAMLCRKGITEPCWPLLKRSSIPNTRSGLIHRAAELQIAAEDILDAFETQSDDGVRAAMLLMLGTLDWQRDKVDESDNREIQRRRCRNLAKQLFLADEDAEVHSSSQWLLTRLGDEDVEREWIRQQSKKLADRPRVEGQRWSINSQGQTMIRIDRLGHPFEISSTEVTTSQYANYEHLARLNPVMAPDKDCPVIQVTWFDAANYCRWLTEQEGMTEADQCHPPTRADQDSILLYDDYKNRRGYRLPTDVEWESAYFGASQSRFEHGHDASIIQQYGWVIDIDVPHVQIVGLRKPTQSGLFDMIGNVSEWTAGLGRGDHRFAVRGPEWNAGLDRILTLIREGDAQPETIYYSYGFRVARSVPEP